MKKKLAAALILSTAISMTAAGAVYAEPGAGEAPYGEQMAPQTEQNAPQGEQLAPQDKHGAPEGEQMAPQDKHGAPQGEQMAPQNDMQPEGQMSGRQDFEGRYGSGRKPDNNNFGNKKDGRRMPHGQDFNKNSNGRKTYIGNYDNKNDAGQMPENDNNMEQMPHSRPKMEHMPGDNAPGTMGTVESIDGNIITVKVGNETKTYDLSGVSIKREVAPGPELKPDESSSDDSEDKKEDARAYEKPNDDSSITDSIGNDDTKAPEKPEEGSSTYEADKPEGNESPEIPEGDSAKDGKMQPGVGIDMMPGIGEKPEIPTEDATIEDITEGASIEIITDAEGNVSSVIIKGERPMGAIRSEDAGGMSA